ncbi:hypothetical protein [Piscinibacter sp.]|uniref:hypothetical protein n=1 Tax=Piscinibacter sp. TaxID=1903157 RepID=UPI0035B41695
MIVFIVLTSVLIPLEPRPRPRRHDVPGGASEIPPSPSWKPDKGFVVSLRRGVEPRGIPY